MTNLTPPRRLTEGFYTDVDLTEVDSSEDADLTEADVRPIVIFLLPGIRSSKAWAQDFTIYSQSVLGRTVHAHVVSGVDDLSSLDLILRHRLSRFRRDYEDQIIRKIAKIQDADISFVCHSMGSAIFADIISRVRARIDKMEKGHQITNIIFLGSVCHKTHSAAMGASCRRFVNDAGTRDRWVLCAGVINPRKYEAVGRFGFSRADVEDRFFDGYNHSSPTAEEHISTWIMPVIEDGLLVRPSGSIQMHGFQTYRLARKFGWSLPFMFLLLVALLIIL